MNLPTMKKLLQYMNEMTAVHRNYDTISRLQHELMESAEPDLPLKSGVYYEAAYHELYKHLDAIRARLNIAPRPDGGIDSGEIYSTLVVLMSRIAELQRFIKPAAGAHWGADWNSVVRMIDGLVKP